MINYSDNKELYFLGAIIGLNIINVGIFWNTKYICFIVASILLFLLLCQDYSKYGVNKKCLIIVSLICLFCGPNN